MELVEQNLLSVIVPIYNVEPYLPRCLDCIINQTYKSLEIICVDDGSTDKSGIIADEYAQRDKRIKVIHKKNEGLVLARQLGLQISKGMYVSNIDSDDYIEADMYAKMMREIIINNADVITSGLIRDYGSHIVYENENIKSGIYEGKCLRESVLFHMIDTGCFYKTNISMHITNKIFKAEYLKKYQLRVDGIITVGEDVAVVFPYLMNASKVVISGECFYHYCVRNDSIMGVKKKNDIDALRKLFLYLGDEIKKIEYENNYYIQMLFIKTYLYLLRDASQILRMEGDTLYPFGDIDRKKAILLYGAGKFGVELKQYLDSNGFNIVAWVDKCKSREGVITLDEVKENNFDIVIIGTLVASTVFQIRKELINIGIEENDIFSVSEGLLKNYVGGENV